MHARWTPDTFRRLAQSFEDGGLFVQARLLRARASMRELGREQLEARKAVIRKALASRDPSLLEKMGDACEQAGMTVAAGKMRVHARALRDAAQIASSKSSKDVA